MYCKKCGTEQREGHKFCPKCGMPFNLNDPVSNNQKKSDIVNEELIDSSVINVMDSQNEVLIKEQSVLSNTQGDTITDDNSDPKKKEFPTVEYNKKQKVVNKQSNDSVLNLINADDISNLSFWGWTSIIGIVIYGFFVFTNNSEDMAHYPVIFCAIAMINPIYTLYKIVKDNKEEKLDLSTAVTISILLCIIMAIVGFMTKEETDGLFAGFLAKLTSLPYQYVYLILIIIANATIKNKELCLYTTAVVVGMLAPIALAVIMYVVVIAIAIAVCYVFGNSSKETSSSSIFNTSSESSSEGGGPHTLNLVDYYVVYKIPDSVPLYYIKKYPSNVTQAQITKDLEWKIGSRAILLEYGVYHFFSNPNPSSKYRNY